MKSRIAIAVGVVAVLGSFIPARAAVPSSQACPIVNGVDPDFVTFQGPATIAGDGANHVVTLFASESEAARNLVVFTVVARATKNNKPAAAVPIVGVANGLHDATVTLSLTGTPGVTYVLDWVANFDFGPHACAWFFPGHFAYRVKVV